MITIFASALSVALPIALVCGLFYFLLSFGKGEQQYFNELDEHERKIS